MYFPYLRGKQYEMIAVRESGFLSNGRIIPVFEPISLSDSACKRFQTIVNKGVTFSVIVNSNNGKPPPKLSTSIQMVNNLELHAPGMVLPAFEIRAGHTINQVKDFAKMFTDRQCVLVHRDHTHSETALAQALANLSRHPVHIFLDGGVPLKVINGLPAAGKVLLRNGFSKCETNGEYPKQSNFDDLLFDYKRRGFDGFSDFSIIGDIYSPGGGAAKHVALHLTEHRNTTIVTNHFVSRTPPQQGDVRTKYFDALNLLISHTGQPPSMNFDTQGVRAYYDSYVKGHFPGLGKLKQWSMMHHMEIIDKILEAKGVQNFV